MKTLSIPARMRAAFALVVAAALTVAWAPVVFGQDEAADS